MRKTILGYDQNIAIELGLQIADLHFLIWLRDFAPFMIPLKDGNDIYYWVNGGKFISDYKILNIKPEQFRKSIIRRLVDAEVLVHKKVNNCEELKGKQKGFASFYGYGPNYEKLLGEKNQGYKSTVDNTVKNQKYKNQAENMAIKQENIKKTINLAQNQRDKTTAEIKKSEDLSPQNFLPNPREKNPREKNPRDKTPVNNKYINNNIDINLYIDKIKSSSSLDYFKVNIDTIHNYLEKVDLENISSNYEELIFDLIKNYPDKMLINNAVVSKEDFVQKLADNCNHDFNDWLTIIEASSSPTVANQRKYLITALFNMLAF